MAEEADKRKDAFINLLAKFLMTNDHASPPILPVIRFKTFSHILDLYHYFLDDAPKHLYFYSLRRAADDLYDMFSAVIRFQEAVKNDQEATENDQNPLPPWKKQLTHWTPKADQWSVNRPLPGAVELHEAGVKFKKNSSFKYLFDVKFHRGVLEIPLLQLDSNKKILLANLLALEKHETRCHQTVTSYVTLMDSLINTKQDVALLQHAGVIHNKLRDHKEAANFFNQLGENLSVDNANNDFVELFKDIQQHYDSSWNRSRAHLMHHYFNSPWAIISVIAGVILLGLTMAQTFFTVYPYYRPSSLLGS